MLRDGPVVLYITHPGTNWISAVMKYCKFFSKVLYYTVYVVQYRELLKPKLTIYMCCSNLAEIQKIFMHDGVEEIV